MDQFEVTPVPGTGADKEPQFVPGISKQRRIFNSKTVKTVLLLCVLAVAFIGIVLFFLRKPFNSSGVEFKITGPAEAVAGEEVTYSIGYKNKTKSMLGDASLTLFYPPDSLKLNENENAEPAANEHINIGMLAPGQEGQKEFKAILLGERGNIRTARAILSYRPENVASDFEDEAELATTITSVPVKLQLFAPPSAVSGQKISYFLDYENETNEDLTGLRLLFKYPEKFVLSSFDPPASLGQTVWDITLLKPGEKRRITIQGTIAGSERETKTISATLQKRINNQYMAFEKAESSTVIGESPLLISLNVNNSREYISFAGDSLDYGLEFTNNSGRNLFGVVITARLEGTMYDLATLDTNGSFNSATRTITWDTSAISELEALNPNQSGSAGFKVKIKRNFPSGGLGSKDYFVKVSAVAKAGIDSDSGETVELTGKDDLVTKITTAPSFTADLTARGGPFGGSGPIPPKVGQKTVYTVHWKLVNPGNEISLAKVTASLQPGVVWEDKSQVQGTSASITFNNLRKTVEWNLGNILSQAGTSNPVVEGYFLVSITPSENQSGQSVELLKDTVFSGTDSFTKQAISLRVPDMNTGFAEDAEGGAVQP